MASSPAHAQPGTEEQRAACTPDVFRLCGAEIPDADKIVACLKREHPRLSVACQQVFNTPPAAKRPPSTVGAGKPTTAGAATPCTVGDSQDPSQTTGCQPVATKQ
jgi:hypothetical protein